MLNNSHKILPSLLVIGLLFPLFAALAQNGSVARPRGTSTATSSTAAATSTSVATPTTAATSTPGAVESQTPSSTGTPNTIPATTNPTASATPSPTQDTPSTKDTGSSVLPWIALAALAIVPFGFLVVQSLKNKKTKEEKKDTAGCFDIKKLLDKKLEELTDLKGALQDTAEDAAKEKIRETLTGTPAGDMLALIEKTEKEYGRLKKLYEECTVEFEKRMFKGTIVENSLNSKSILDKLKIKRTYQLDDWTLHNVLVSEDQISELSKCMADGPWYIHLWKTGRDDVKVIFKNKVFDIKFSDKSTWVDAVAYGKSIGIPDEQLDFPIE